MTTTSRVKEAKRAIEGPDVSDNNASLLPFRSVKHLHSAGSRH